MTRETPDAADETTTHFVYREQDVEDDPTWKFREQDVALTGRLYNFKFEQALMYVNDDHGEDVVTTIQALASVFGNTGYMPRAQMSPVVWAAVRWIFTELEKLNQTDAVVDKTDTEMIKKLTREIASGVVKREEK